MIVYIKHLLTLHKQQVANKSRSSGITFIELVLPMLPHSRRPQDADSGELLYHTANSHNKSFYALIITNPHSFKV